MTVLSPRLLVSRLRRVSKTCLVLLPDLSRRCASKLRVLKGETTPDSEVVGGKRPKRLGLNEEVQKSPTFIILDSPEEPLMPFQL